MQKILNYQSISDKKVLHNNIEIEIWNHWKDFEAFKLISKQESVSNCFRLNYPTYELRNYWMNWYNNIKCEKYQKISPAQWYQYHSILRKLREAPIYIGEFDQESQILWEVSRNRKCQQEWFLEVGVPILPSSESNIAKVNWQCRCITNVQIFSKFNLWLRCHMCHWPLVNVCKEAQKQKFLKI